MNNRLKGFFGLPNQVLGIALENDAAYFMEVALGRKGRVLRNIVSIDHFREQSSAAIQQIISRYGIQANQAVVALDCRQVFFRAVSFPYMEEKELLATVKWEVQRHIPYEEDTYYYDCAFLGCDPADNKSMVMIVAVKKETIALLMEKFLALGLRLAAVESDIFSLARLVKTEQNYMIVSMRRKEHVVMAYQDGVPLFVRSFNFDTDRELLNTLSQAVLRSLEQYKLQRRVSVQTVYLCGDCTGVDLTYLTKEWGIALQLLSPIKSLCYDSSFVESDLHRQAMQAAAAIGTVLRGDLC